MHYRIRPFKKNRLLEIQMISIKGTNCIRSKKKAAFNAASFYRIKYNVVLSESSSISYNHKCPYQEDAKNKCPVGNGNWL